MKTPQVALLLKIYGLQIIPERQRTFPTEGFPRDDLPLSPRSCVPGVGPAFPPEASARSGPREVPARSQRSTNICLVLCLTGGHAEEPQARVPFSHLNRPHKRDRSSSPSCARRAGGTCPSPPPRKHSHSTLKGHHELPEASSAATCRRKPRLEASRNPARATWGGAGCGPCSPREPKGPAHFTPAGLQGARDAPGGAERQVGRNLSPRSQAQAAAPLPSPRPWAGPLRTESVSTPTGGA